MWPLNAQPHIKERQIALQNLAGKEPVYLRKPGSKLYMAGFLALLGVGLTGNMYYLIQYGRGKAPKKSEAA